MRKHAIKRILFAIAPRPKCLNGIINFCVAPRRALNALPSSVNLTLETSTSNELISRENVISARFSTLNSIWAWLLTWKQLTEKMLIRRRVWRAQVLLENNDNRSRLVEGKRVELVLKAPVASEYLSRHLLNFKLSS